MQDPSRWPILVRVSLWVTFFVSAVIGIMVQGEVLPLAEHQRSIAVGIFAFPVTLLSILLPAFMRRRKREDLIQQNHLTMEWDVGRPPSGVRSHVVGESLLAGDSSLVYVLAKPHHAAAVIGDTLRGAAFGGDVAIRTTVSELSLAQWDIEHLWRRRSQRRATYKYPIPRPYSLVVAVEVRPADRHKVEANERKLRDSLAEWPKSRLVVVLLEATSSPHPIATRGAGSSRLSGRRGEDPPGVRQQPSELLCLLGRHAPLEDGLPLLHVPVRLSGQLIYWKATARRLVGPVCYLILAAVVAYASHAVLTNSEFAIYEALKVIGVLSVGVLLVAVAALNISGPFPYDHKSVRANLMDVGCGVVVGYFAVLLARDIHPDQLGVMASAVTILFLRRRLAPNIYNWVSNNSSTSFVFFVATGLWFALCPAFVARATWSTWSLVAGVLCALIYQRSPAGRRWTVASLSVCLISVMVYATIVGFRDAMDAAYIKENLVAISIFEAIVPQCASLLVWLALLIALTRNWTCKTRLSLATKPLLLPAVILALGLWIKIVCRLLAAYDRMPSLLSHNGRPLPAFVRLITLDQFDLAIIALILTPGIYAVIVLCFIVRGKRPLIAWLFILVLSQVLFTWAWDVGLVRQASFSVNAIVSAIFMFAAAVILASLVHLNIRMALRASRVFIVYLACVYGLLFGVVLLTTVFIRAYIREYAGTVGPLLSPFRSDSDFGWVKIVDLQYAAQSVFPTALLITLAAALFWLSRGVLSLIQRPPTRRWHRMLQFRNETAMVFAVFTAWACARHVGVEGSGVGLQIVSSGLLGAGSAAAIWCLLRSYYPSGSLNFFMVTIGFMSVIFFQSIFGFILCVGLLVLGGPFESNFRRLQWPSMRSLAFASCVAGFLIVYVASYDIILISSRIIRGSGYGGLQWIAVGSIFVLASVLHPLNAHDFAWSELQKNNDRIRTLVFWIAIPGLMFLTLTFTFVTTAYATEATIEHALFYFILGLVLCNMAYVGLMGWVSGAWAMLPNLRSDGEPVLRELRRLSEQRDDIKIEGLRVRISPESPSDRV